MHFAFVIFRYFSFGGLQRSMKNIAVACIEAGHEVTVFTTEWSGEKIPGVKVVTLKNKQKSTRKRDSNFATEFKKSVDKSKFNLIVGFNKIPGLDIYYSGDTCYAAKAYEKHSFFYRSTPRCRKNLKLENSVFKKDLNTQILIVADEQIIDYKKYYNTEDERFYIIPPGISKDRIAPENRSDYGKKLRREINIPQDWQIVTMVASNLKLKGYDRSFNSFVSLPDSIKSKTLLLLVGADKNIDQYKQKIENTGLSEHVKFLGGRNDIPEILFGSDLLIHPAYREATGNVLLEAAVAAVPVLCSEICGYSHYISDNNLGIVIKEPFEQKKLDDALYKMLTDQSQREVWKNNVLKFSKNKEVFSRPTRVVKIFEDVSKKL